MPDPQTYQPPKPYVRIESSPDDDLAELLTMYAAAKERQKAATEQVDVLKARLKTLAEPGLTDDVDTVHLCESNGELCLMLQRTSSWRLDTKRIKAERPDIYAAYAVQSSAVTLRDVR